MTTFHKLPFFNYSGELDHEVGTVLIWGAQGNRDAQNVWCLPPRKGVWIPVASWATLGTPPSCEGQE